MSGGILRESGTRAISAAWSFLSFVAREISRRGWVKPVPLGSRVISVGNIQAGGAGKTPLVAQIAREASQKGLNVAILLRGYKSRWENGEGGIILPEDPVPETQLCGDEAALLHDLAPAAAICVGADRVKSFRLLQARWSKPIDCVILDDAFQNWRIQKDVELVAVTSRRPGEVFFRDGFQALTHADLIIWTKGIERPLVPKGKPLVHIRFKVQNAEANHPALLLVTGVGDGDFVRNSVEEEGFRVARHVRFPDHAQYLPSEIESLLASARAHGERVALTGKDWVKWREAGVSREQVLVLEPVLIFEEGREAWEKVLWEK